MKVKKLLFFSGLIFLSTFLLAQEKINLENRMKLPQGIDHAFGDFNISLSPGYVNNLPYESLFVGGLKLSVFVSKRFSFDTDFVFGKDYLHWGPGLIGLPLWMALFSPNGLNFNSDETNSTFGLFVASLLLMVCSIEHFAYHVPVNNNIEITPYASLLRFKQLSNVENSLNPDNSASACFAIGVEMDTFFKKFIFSPYFEYNLAYDGNIHGANYGIYLGYCFSKR